MKTDNKFILNVNEFAYMAALEVAGEAGYPPNILLVTLENEPNIEVGQNVFINTPGKDQQESVAILILKPINSLSEEDILAIDAFSETDRDEVTDSEWTLLLAKKTPWN